MRLLCVVFHPVRASHSCSSVVLFPSLCLCLSAPVTCTRGTRPAACCLCMLRCDQRSAEAELEQEFTAADQEQSTFENQPSVSRLRRVAQLPGWSPSPTRQPPRAKLTSRVSHNQEMDHLCLKRTQEHTAKDAQASARNKCPQPKEKLNQKEITYGQPDCVDDLRLLQNKWRQSHFGLY